MKRAVNLISLLVIVSAMAALVWSAPVIFKGYSIMELWKSSLLARNLSQENFFGTENNRNVLLASSLVKEQGQLTTESNRLTPIVLAQIFKLTGVPQYDNLIFVSIAILILALLIFTLTVYYLFNLKVAALFAFIYILLPFNWWYAPYNFGTYEVALVFFSVFFLLYFIGIKSKSGPGNVFIPLAGIFLALAGIARETFFVAAPVFLIYLFFKRQKKYLLFLFIPFFITLSFFWLPDIISGENSFYSSYLLKSGPEEEKTTFLSWDFVAHFYPDPYTYHFEREQYLKDNYDQLLSSDMNFLERAILIKRATNVGIEVPGFFDRLKLSSVLLIRHLFRFLAIEDIGGPLIFFFLFLGFCFLKKRKRDLSILLSFWIVFSLLVFTLILAGRNHLIDFGWAIALTVVLGVIFFGDILSEYFRLGRKARTTTIVLLSLLVLYNLILSGHVLWGRIYDQPHHLEILAYAEEVKKKDVDDKDVIAIGLDEFKINKLNYLTDKSMVIFAPQTLENLIQERRLQFAFDEFEVKYILGYSPELTGQILSNSDVQNIASDDVEISLPEASRTKNWLMNLVR